MRWIERQHPRDSAGKFAHTPGNALMNATLRGTPERVSLGVTPYRGKPAKSPDDPKLSSYRQSPRYKHFESTLHKRAGELGLSIRRQDDSAGVWEGSLEPSTAVDVEGDPAKVQQLAKELRDEFHQDAVMEVREDPEGPDAVHDIENVDPKQALQKMKEVGLPGGTLIGDTLQIADPGGKSRASVGRLANLLGGKLRTRGARVEFV